MAHPTQSSLVSRLPALRLDAHGARKVDLRAVVALAMPLFAFPAIDVAGLAAFQAMQVSAGAAARPPRS